MNSKIEQLGPLFQKILVERGVELERAAEWAQELQRAATYHLTVAPARTHIAIPKQRPMDVPSWSEKDKRLPGETPVAFIERHYKPWLEHGLTRADIYYLDRPLYAALAKWLQKDGNNLAEGFLPTRKERVDDWVNAVTAGQEVDPKYLNRLASAIERRSDSLKR